jgi:hypothetical protein
LQIKEGAQLNVEIVYCNCEFPSGWETEFYFRKLSPQAGLGVDICQPELKILKQMGKKHSLTWG